MQLNVKMNLKEIGYEDVDWICLARDADQLWALLNMVMYLWVA
jgi:hypothetical protein